MDLQNICARLDEERRSLARRGEVLEVLADVTRRRSADGTHHHILFSSLTASTADAILKRELEHYRALNVGFEWKVYAHDTPADLLDRLREFKFEIGPCEAVMIFDLSTAPAWISGPGSIVGVRRIETLADVAIYQRVAEEAFGKNYSFTANELAEGLRNHSIEHQGYIAYYDDNPVSIARLYTHPQSEFAGLYGGATLPAWRSRGFYRALVAARATDAMARGAKYLLVDALPTSRPILERMGFQHLTDTWPCQWNP